MRNTHQRDAIRRVLVEAGRPLGPQELVKAAQEHAPSVGIATVYRTIKRFLETGLLVAIELPGEPARYELAGKHHHHHFRCRECEGVFELEGCDLGLERLLPKGFVLDEHAVVLYGRCASCAAARKRRPAAKARHRH